MRRPIVLLASSLLLLMTIAAPAAAVAAEPDLHRVIVEVRADTDVVRGLADEVTALRGGHTGATFRHALNGFVAELTPRSIAALARDPSVIRITPDYPIRIAAEEPSTGFDRIEADLIHGGGVPPTDVDIAIIDTGVADHPDLNVVHRVDCSSLFGVCTDNAGFDGNGHGTVVAGIAAAIDNEIGVIGVAPGARIWSVKVMNDDGSGYLSSLVAGIDWVTGRAAEIDVANMSLAGEFSNVTFDNALSNSVAAGITYAVAAGNDGVDAAAYSPASHPEVLTVSAVADADGAGGGHGVFFNRPAETDDEFATFSNYGAVVDIAAPGVNLRSTGLGDGYVTKSGTSVSSPLVAGAAALYVAMNGRDANEDGLVNGADVAKVRNDLLADAIPQTDLCAFSGDPDAADFPEPLLTVNGDAFGGSGTCLVADPDPSPPVGLTFTADPVGFDVQIDWTEAVDAESGILSYQVWRDGSVVAETDHTGRSYVDKPQSGTSFTYEMTATNRQGVASERSGPIVVSVPDGDRDDAGWWPFDESSGATAADATPWERDGVVVGGASWEPVGQVDGALNFNGADNRVDLDASILDGAADATAAMWVRTTKTGNQAFISAANSSNDNEFLLFAYSDIAVRSYTAAGFVQWDVPSFADGQWHHFALTRDAANDQETLFIDGVSKGAKSVTLGPLAVESGGLLLGQEQDSLGGGFDSRQAFAGTMDDVRLYTRILTAQEIADLASMGTPDTDPPAAPTGLGAVPGDTQVTLDWTDNTESDLASYTVWRAEVDGGPYSELAAGVGSSDYVDNSVSNGTTYYYVVTAVDGIGNESGFSDQASATPGSTGDPDVIDFTANPVLSYGGSQDVSGTVDILDGGTTLRLSGNLWKKIDFPYDITPNTVLEFEFASSVRGEIHGIGFDTDNNITKGRTFQLFGSQTWGLQNFRTYQSSDFVGYEIPVGQFYTGSVVNLFFANDHDVSNPTGESIYKNVRIYEKPPPPPTVIDFTANPVLSYGGSQDVSGTVDILDGGTTLRLSGNLWKKIDFPYNITPNTVLEFEFSSSAEGEIQGIGFDTDNNITKGRTFQLFGSQTWGRQNFNNYAPSDFVRYVIPVGHHYTGSVVNLFFANDHDVSNPTGESIYRNVTIYEGG